MNGSDVGRKGMRKRNCLHKCFLIWNSAVVGAWLEEASYVFKKGNILKIEKILAFRKAYGMRWSNI